MLAKRKTGLGAWSLNHQWHGWVGKTCPSSQSLQSFYTSSRVQGRKYISHLEEFAIATSKGVGEKKEGQIGSRCRVHKIVTSTPVDWLAVGQNLESPCVNKN